jgi:hypothetical protein
VLILLAAGVPPASCFPWILRLDNLDPRHPATHVLHIASRPCLWGAVLFCSLFRNLRGVFFRWRTPCVFADHKILEVLERILHELREIRRELRPQTPTPTSVAYTLQGDTMALVPGTTAVFTGVTSPAGSSFPAGTTFTVTTTDPTVTATVDATGLIVTLVLPTTFVDDPANPFSFTVTSSTFVPVPSTSPSSISTTTTPSIPIPTPLSVTFTQTS